jgi:serine/threonine protein kinase
VAELLRAWNIHLSQGAVELLSALLSGDPSRRPSVADIRRFPWFQRRGQP